MKKICVYCGSRKPNDTDLADLAVQLGKWIAQKDWEVVYGGGKVGMMGLVSDAALSENGKVTGVIPTALKKAEIVHPGLTNLHETQDMHTRKALLETLSDAFVVLPGGYGTMDEFFEILTWKQLGIHKKPIILVNAKGYYDGLETFSKRALSEDYIRENTSQLFQIAYSLEDCAKKLESLFE